MIEQASLEKGPLADIADRLGISPAQLAPARLLQQGQDVFPIPGSGKPQRLDVNAAAIEVRLEPSVLREIDQIAARGAAAGANLL